LAPDVFLRDVFPGLLPELGDYLSCPEGTGSFFGGSFFDSRGSFVLMFSVLTSRSGGIFSYCPPLLPTSKLAPSRSLWCPFFWPLGPKVPPHVEVCSPHLSVFSSASLPFLCQIVIRSVLDLPVKPPQGLHQHLSFRPTTSGFRLQSLPLFMSLRYLSLRARFGSATERAPPAHAKVNPDPLKSPPPPPLVGRSLLLVLAGPRPLTPAPFSLRLCGTLPIPFSGMTRLPFGT